MDREKNYQEKMAQDYRERIAAVKDMPTPDRAPRKGDLGVMKADGEELLVRVDSGGKNPAVYEIQPGSDGESQGAYWGRGEVERAGGLTNYVAYADAPPFLERDTGTLEVISESQGRKGDTHVKPSAPYYD